MGVRAVKEQVKIDHFYFGKVTLKNQFNKQLITVNKPMMRTDQIIQWQSKYKIAVTLNKQSLLLPESYDPVKVPKFFMCCQCPADMEIALTYQKFDYTLEKQINTRKQSMKFFKQSELFFIWYKLLQGCKQFQLKNLKVGDIRPGKIVKMKKGDLKLINVASFPNQYTPIQRFLDQLDTKTPFLLSPEQIIYLKSRGYSNQKYPNAKTQSFSLGLTILQCATLTNSSDMYQKPTYKGLNSNELQFRLKSIQSRYKYLHKYLKYVCQLDQNKRLSSGEIWAILTSYSMQIMQLKDFSVKETAEKQQLRKFQNTLKIIKAQQKSI